MAPQTSVLAGTGGTLAPAAMAADGHTVVTNAEHIDRGYDGFVEKLSGLGGDIRREVVDG